jgi:hypothetical protein
MKHFNHNKTRSEPFVADVPAVQSARLPAKLAWRAFDDFARYTSKLLLLWSEEDDAPEDNPGTYNLLVKFFATVEAFDRPEFYQETEQSQPDLLNCYRINQIKRCVVSDQVGLLIGSFPNGTPNSPEVYTKFLIEEIVAANPSVIALEATCREIRRTKKFLPAIVEVLDILRNQARWWSDAWEDICTLDGYLARRSGRELIPCDGGC